MGVRFSLRGMGYAAGEIITYNSGASQIQILSLGSGAAVQWQTGGDDRISLPPGTVLRPVPENGWLYTLGADGFLTSSADPSAIPAQPGDTILPPPPVIPPSPQEFPGEIAEGAIIPRPSIIPIPPPAPFVPPDGVFLPPGEAPELAPPGGLASIPGWAWLVGGGVLLYLFTRR
mgnify:CR=1 FL=1